MNPLITAQVARKDNSLRRLLMLLRETSEAAVRHHYAAPWKPHAASELCR